MGRATYDSIGRPLPGRTTIVVTRDPDWSPTECSSPTPSRMLSTSRPSSRETFVVGGTQLYEQALPVATHQVLTEVDLAPDGDTHYRAGTARLDETRREPGTDVD